jgi:predicted permease
MCCRLYFILIQRCGFLFIDNMLTAGTQVIILYIIVFLGFIAERLGVYAEKTAKATTNFLFYFITPAVIVNAFLSTQFSVEKAKSYGIAFLCGVATHVGAILISAPFFRKGKHPDNAVYKYASIYANMGYMALPLAEAVIGPEGVFYCSAGVITFNIFSFTHGVWLMESDSEEKKFNIKSLILNPGVLSVMVGLPLFLFSVRLPLIVAKPITYMASMNTPLAMVILGTYISKADFKTVFKDGRLFGVLALKLVLVPLTMFAVFKLAGVSGALLTAVLISASAPSASNTVMFAAKYDKNTRTASKVVSFVTFLSILTMPVIIALSKL